MRDLGRAHASKLVVTHGDHVPVEVRNAAVVAFWLPDFLGVDWHSMRSVEAKVLVCVRFGSLCCC